MGYNRHETHPIHLAKKLKGGCRITASPFVVYQLDVFSVLRVLPRLELSFRAELRRYQEERRMPYITGFEIDGMVQAHRKNIIEVLETRFETVPQGLSDRINEIDDLALLKSLHKRAITVASVEEFEQVIASI